MNKEEYIQWAKWFGRWERVSALSSLLLLFLGIPLAAITPPPWNAVALLLPYFGSIGLRIIDPVGRLTDWKAVNDFKHRAIDSYQGDKTAYLTWRSDKFRNWPLYNTIHHSRWLESRKVLRRAVEAYNE